jgi:ABC-type multidrug transport system fused ATPase/permease subunit
LYHNPAVLVLDEATSALDGITENIIMDAIRNLAHQKTIIMIAHRISTVQTCDDIFMLERGRIVAHGDYNYLMQTNSRFRDMANISPRDIAIEVVT